MTEQAVKETDEQYEERFQRMMFYVERIATLLNVEHLSEVNKTSLNTIMNDHIYKFHYNL